MLSMHPKSSTLTSASLSKVKEFKIVDPLYNTRVDCFDSTLRDNKGEARKEESQYPVNAGDSQERVSSGCQDVKVVKHDQEFSLGDGVKDVDKLSGETTKDDKITIEVQSGDVKCETRTEGGPRAYRGFEVRRWEPLKKLKKIARIEGELNKVRLDVQNLVSSVEDGGWRNYYEPFATTGHHAGIASECEEHKKICCKGTC
ncbi:hypothetical protein POM88_032998 [Heracleum sosnowskyi]|uniref:Uncharacterized protein n=1 Tax=Heracleum sosnowskyi TaxID=360622 RepID=A0AAD8I199_9APIA|nr:hypothetical protein POM88_032998 [Heracleum sosnowskyi]